MAGQGSLCRIWFHFRCRLWASRQGMMGLLGILLLVSMPGRTSYAADDLRPMIDIGLRLTWHADQPVDWSVEIATESKSNPVQLYDPVNRDGTPQAAGSLWLTDNESGLRVQPRIALAGGDVTFRLRGPAEAKLTVRITANGRRGAKSSQTQSWTLGQLAQGGDLRDQRQSAGTPVDFDWNLQRPSDDELQIQFQTDGSSEGSDPTRWSFVADETIRITTQTSSLLRLASRRLVLQTTLVQVPDGQTVWSHRSPLAIDSHGNSEPVSIDERIPSASGVYELRCEVEADIDSIWNRIRRREPPLARVGRPVVVFSDRGPSSVSAAGSSDESSPDQTATEDSSQATTRLGEVPPAADPVNWKQVGRIRPADSTWNLGQWFPQSPSQLIHRATEPPVKLKTLKHESTPVSLLAAGQTFQATLPVQKPGRPHRITIRFPGNQPIRLQVNVGPPESFSGSNTKRETATSKASKSFVILYPSSIEKRAGWQSHSFLYYPNDHDQIWLTNLAEQPTPFHSVTVEAGPASLTPPGSIAEAGRPLILNVNSVDGSSGLSNRTMAADLKSYSTNTRQAFRQWVTSEQLISEVIRAGMNGLMVPLPVDSTNSLELLMQHARARNVRVWIRIPGQRSLRGLEQIIAEQPDRLSRLTHATGNRAARYNILNPTVQSILASWLRGIHERYVIHESFAGFAFSCEPSSHFAVPANPESDPSLMQQFAAETETELPSGEADLLEVADQIQTWLESKQTQAYRAVCSQLQPTMILLLGRDRLDGQPAGPPSTTESITELLPTTVLRYGSDQVLSDTEWMRRQLSALPAEGSAINAVSIVHDRQRATRADDRLIYRHDLIADLVELIDRVDPPRLIIERDLLIQQDNPSLRRIFAGYAGLPRIPMQRVKSLDAANETVRVRTAYSDGYFHVVITNLVPWPSEVELETEGEVTFTAHPATEAFEPEVSESGVTAPGIVERRSGNRTRVTVPATSQIVLRSTKPGDVRTLRFWSSRVGGGVPTLDEIKHRVTRIVERLGALSRLDAYSALTNGDFEQIGEVGLPGWLHAQHPPGCVTTDSNQPYQGERSVRMTTDPSATHRTWIVSETIQPPASGRLAVSLAYRGAKSAQADPHRLKISLEGTSKGRPLRFSEVFEVSRNGQWNSHQVVLEADGIDALEVDSFRLTIDSVSGGQIWIDRIQLHDQFATARERDELQSLAFLAVQGLQRGNLAPCGRLLKNDWARHLLHLEEVPSADPRPKPSKKTERDPSVAERIRSWLPKPLRF